MKGRQYKSVGTTVREKLSYVDIPVLLQLSAKGIFFEAGPQVGFLVGRSVIANSLDVGYVCGLGYQLASGFSFNVGLRYNGGISKVYELNTYDANNRPVATYAPRNEAFQLYVGYLFGNQ